MESQSPCSEIDIKEKLTQAQAAMSVYLGGKWRELQLENEELRSVAENLKKRHGDDTATLAKLQVERDQQEKVIRVLQVKHAVLEKQHQIVREQNRWYAGDGGIAAKAKTAAISLADLCHGEDCDLIDAVSTASFQRLGLLIILSLLLITSIVANSSNETCSF